MAATAFFEPKPAGDRALARKNVGGAICLALLFGPLGLFYATVWGGFVLSLICVLLFPLMAYLRMGVLWSLAFVWITSIVWAAIAARAHNQDVESWLKPR